MAKIKTEVKEDAKAPVEVKEDAKPTKEDYDELSLRIAVVEMKMQALMKNLHLNFKIDANKLLVVK